MLKQTALLRMIYTIYDNDLNFDDNVEFNPKNNTVQFKIVSKISYDQIKCGLNHHLNMLNLPFVDNKPTKNSTAFYIQKKIKENETSYRLGTKSAALINHYYSKKHKECKDIFICDNSESFINTLKKINTLTAPYNFNLGLELVLPEGHMVPIKLEKRNGHNYFTVVDSVANKKYLN